MTLTTVSKRLLETKGILFLEKENNSCIILKRTDAPGNILPNYTSVPIVTMNDQGETVEEINSNSPILMLHAENNQFVLSCWNWVPGPGPGDFEKSFDLEQDVINFIESYYFGFNEYFEDRRKYELAKLE